MSPSDAVDLSSSIGTWIAAFIAIVALVGVVGPFLALQASLSDSNRAFNAVQDLPQKYVTRGLRLTRGLRVLRRVRVPDFAPGYITNEPDTAALVPLRAALGRWVVRPRDYLPWNTGWAKFSELVEAQEVREAATNDVVDLGVTKGGTLEVVNNRTALVVNKHWILLLGLLGRYGIRPDNGVLQKRRVKRDLDGERGSIRHFELPRKEKLMKSDRLAVIYSKEQTKVSRSTARRRMSRSRSSSSASESDPSDAPRFDDEFGDVVFSLRLGPYGEWTMDSKQKPTIHGTTGTMQSLGRHKGSWSYLTSVSFVPHTAREMFAPGIEERREKVSMQTLFWLAHGFVPCGRMSDGRQAVISLESPAEDMEAPEADTFLQKARDPEDWPAFSLQESYDIPISIGYAMKCLSIPEPKILQFLSLERPASEREKATNGHAPQQEASWGDPPKTKIHGKWVQYTKPRRGIRWVFPRKDFERALSLVLGLEWDDWGFLTHQDKFWSSILWSATLILQQDDITGPALARTVGATFSVKAFLWRVRGPFLPHKFADYLAFDKFLTNSFDDSELLPLRLALGTLYVLDEPFRQMIQSKCDIICEDAMRDNKHISEAEILAEKKRLDETLAGIEKEVERKRNDPTSSPEDDSTVDPGNGQPVYTRFAYQHLNEETLQAMNIEYMEDAYDPNHVLIKRWVPRWEQDLLFKHTAIARKLADLKRDEDRSRTGILEYDYPSKQLKWYQDKETMTASHSWRLNGDLVRTPTSEKKVTISEAEIIRIGLWTACRAALWLNSQDSRPLLHFVEELDPYVYVL